MDLLSKVALNTLQAIDDCFLPPTFSFPYFFKRGLLQCNNSLICVNSFGAMLIISISRCRMFNLVQWGRGFFCVVDIPALRRCGIERSSWAGLTGLLTGLIVQRMFECLSVIPHQIHDFPRRVNQFFKSPYTCLLYTSDAADE